MQSVFDTSSIFCVDVKATAERFKKDKSDYTNLTEEFDRLLNVNKLSPKR